MKDLMTQLNLEAEDVQEKAEQVIQEGELLDGTPVSGQKESAIKEMMDHADKARMMSNQLNELADKADDILKEDKQHLVNEIATEAFQMNYRHIMENAGLLDGVVSFESSDKSTELNYLSNEARKMANIANNLESRILLDFSPEGKIMSFLRADSKRLATARGDIQSYSDKILRKGNLSDISNVQVEWSLLSQFKEWIIYKDGKAVTDLTQAVIDDIDLILESFETIKKNNRIINQMITELGQGKEPSASTIKQMKQPEIIGKHILGDKFIKPSSGDFFRLFGWTPANPPLWMVPIIAMTGALAPFVIVAAQKIRNKMDLEKAGTKIDGNKLKTMVNKFNELNRVLDRDEHTEFDMKKIKSGLSGDAKRIALDLAKQSTRTQNVLYEQAFFLTVSIAEVMRGLNGSWELFLGQAQV